MIQGIAYIYGEEEKTVLRMNCDDDFKIYQIFKDFNVKPIDVEVNPTLSVDESEILFTEYFGKINEKVDLIITSFNYADKLEEE